VAGTAPPSQTEKDIVRTVDAAIDRLRAEFMEMPGLRLTSERVQRLCGVERMVCQTVLDELVKTKFLCRKPSRQLGDIHYMNESRPFDFLIAVLFNDGFPAVHRAYQIPLSIVRQFIRKKRNRDVLLAQGPVLTAFGVEDITAKLR
jgi:hypothetical protein